MDFALAHGRSDDDFYAEDEFKYHGGNRWSVLGDKGGGGKSTHFASQ